jgi:hypothetical protein
MEDRLAISSYFNVNLRNLAGEIGANFESCDRTEEVPSLQRSISLSDESLLRRDLPSRTLLVFRDHEIASSNTKSLEEFLSAHPF